PIDPDELFGKLLKWINPRMIQKVPETAVVPHPIEPGVKKEKTPEQQDDLPEIPGLDTDLGLKRVMGKKAFYLDMLRKYVDNQLDAPLQIRRSLDTEDYKTAERLAHTAKGVSGNIGATILQEIAATLEKAIREQLPKAEIAAILETFGTEHGMLIAGLQKAFPAVDIREETVEVDEAQSAIVYEKMIELLTNDDSEAVDYLGSEYDALRSMLGAKHFIPFESAIKQYDFENALELLKPHAKS
ncbi:MAG: Hpt domain-containing protein, partial [Chloroflexota bacterium]